jgi:hypothetical protein
VAKDIDGMIFSYGVFSFPNFSAVAAKNTKVPIMLAANLNPDWPGMVAMLAAGGALHHLEIDHYRVAGDVTKKEILDKILHFSREGDQHILGFFFSGRACRCESDRSSPDHHQDAHVAVRGGTGCRERHHGCFNKSQDESMPVLFIFLLLSKQVIRGFTMVGSGQKG